ncbi:hypothetical protein SAMN05216223_102193 [Actinacidiphila yanglinensis]|uniref:Uncharacterized protein n=1 Tax=Actinacidiphila yanglinensis TaxID=310779 RepID=A0A1H5V8J2_9ACTN|nr:hypothetical protein [Actinacidiphila yanglinensis]SEF83523.1 hypothetical protein SAMN05216223_102193 [Actinacidiphila yanglinensis]
MFLYAVAFAALGLLVAWGAIRLFPLRLAVNALTLSTGPVAAVIGGLVAYSIVGGHHPEATFPAAVLTSASLLSVLARPPRRGRHAKVFP